MKKVGVLAHEFVEFIPDTLKEGTTLRIDRIRDRGSQVLLRVWKEVVTPLSPSDWKLIFDGKTISLDPSIGNWGFKCQSHYWIRNNRVRWAARWSKDKVNAGRAHDRFAKEKYFGTADTGTHGAPKDTLRGSRNRQDRIWAFGRK